MQSLTAYFLFNHRLKNNGQGTLAFIVNIVN